MIKNKMISKWLLTNTETLGFIAAFLGTLSLVPQVLKTWNSHSTRDISLIMYLIISLDSLLWLTYGFVLSLTPLIFQSSITFSCASLMIIMKLLWK
jgi:MtN3 and saliva related transmembrane protein